MAYELLFVPEALEDWAGLDGSLKALFKRALRKRLKTPRVPGSELRSPLSDCFKIKLRGVGYRLVYLVRDDEADPRPAPEVVGAQVAVRRPRRR